MSGSGETFKFGQPGQNVTPSYANVKKRSNGKESIVYGRSDSGSDHGHTVRNADGSVDYARTPSGKVIKDKR
jgi:hypothetical protein